MHGDNRLDVQVKRLEVLRGLHFEIQGRPKIDRGERKGKQTKEKKKRFVNYKGVIARAVVLIRGEALKMEEEKLGMTIMPRPKALLIGRCLSFLCTSRTSLAPVSLHSSNATGISLAADRTRVRKLIADNIARLH